MTGDKPAFVKKHFYIAIAIAFVFFLPGILKAQIATTGSPSVLTTSYGTPSSSTSFMISGAGMTAGILVTPPPGFEVSKDNITFSSTVTVGIVGTIPSTQVYIRLTSKASAGPHSGNIVLSSPGASNVNIAMPISIVTPAPLGVDVYGTKYYGSVVSDFTLDPTTGPTFDFSSLGTGLKNGEMLNSVHLAFSVGTAANDPAGTYPGAVTSSQVAGINGFLASNYIITYVPDRVIVLPAPLTITANNVTKPLGTTITGGPGSTAYTISGLQNGETVSTVTITYGNGSTAGVAMGTYLGSVVPSNAVGANGFLGSNYAFNYVPGNIIVTNTGPVITVSNIVTPVNTVYGTPSSPTTFTISGVNMTAGILVTPPPAFEISKDNISYSNTITTGAGGTIAPTLFYIRLKPTTAVGGYSGNIVLSSTGATSLNINMPNSTVTPAPLTVTISNATKTYGTTQTIPVPFSIKGLKNSETTGILTGNFGIGSAASANVGIYTGSVQGSALGGGTFTPTNYNISYVNGDIIVLPATLTVTADDKSKPYGATNPALTETYQGFVNGETTAQLTTQPMLNTTATAASPAGQYPIKATGGVALNYTFTYVDGKLTVDPVPLTVTADDKTKTFGDPNPTLTMSYQGFVNSDGPSNLTTPPIIATPATQASPIGQYPITASDGVSPNYIFTYLPGTLTINAAELALTIPNAFTPNGDGINDTWDVTNINTYKNVTVEILNRYGTRVYFSNGYPIPWNGKYKNSDVPDGTYYYIISTGPGKKPYSGYLAVIR